MDCRVAYGALTCLLMGCFSDPPPIDGPGSTGGSTTDAATSGSTAPAGTTSSTTTGTDTSASSSSTTAAEESSTGSEDTCGEGFVPDAPIVPVDIVVAVDAQLPMLPPINALFTFEQPPANNHISVIASQNHLDMLMPPPACMSCANNCEMPVSRNAVALADTDNIYEALGQPADFSCMLRPPANGTSGPVRVVWLVTDVLWDAPPAGFAASLLDAGARVSIACNGCAGDSLTDVVSEDWLDLVATSLGSFANLQLPPDNENGPVIQAAAMGASRYSCVWPDQLAPDFLSALDDQKQPQFVAQQIEGPGMCAKEDQALSPDGVGVGAYFEQDGGTVLCPDTCALVQTFAAEFTQLIACNE